MENINLINEKLDKIINIIEDKPYINLDQFIIDTTENSNRINKLLNLLDKDDLKIVLVELEAYLTGRVSRKNPELMAKALEILYNNQNIK